MLSKRTGGGEQGRASTFRNAREKGERGDVKGQVVQFYWGYTSAKGECMGLVGGKACCGAAKNRRLQGMSRSSLVGGAAAQQRNGQLVLAR